MVDSRDSPVVEPRKRNYRDVELDAKDRASDAHDKPNVAAGDPPVIAE